MFPNASEDAKNNIFSTFFFFNANLIAKIEVFGGTIGNSKDDQDDWSLLTEPDLPAAGSPEKIFCRLVLYDEKLKRKMKIPMLDKYFLITG